MRLLIATDHRFIGTDHGVYDTYCFDRAFFRDYRAVFDEVLVAARIRRTQLPKAALRSDGDGVKFLHLPDFQGAKWVGLPRSATLSGLDEAVDNSDAVCVRLPSRSGRVAAERAIRSRKPLMFELIGDPAAAVASGRHGLLARWFGKYDAWMTRRVVARAVAGSYVSAHHLQAGYPPGERTVHDSISSIRLPEDDISAAREWRVAPSPVRIVLVASLVPVKRHDVLLKAVSIALSRGLNVLVDLVGDGPLRPSLADSATSLGIGDAVTFHGHLSSRSEMRRLLDRADLFVMSSASEGMPRAMIEAMARGVPAIGTRVGGIAELLPPHCVVPEGDHVALAELIVDLGRDPQALTNLSMMGVTRASEFSANRLSAKRISLLRYLRACAERAK